jgi:hypothetical protein
MKIIHRLIFCYNNQKLSRLIDLEATSQLEQDLIALTAINLALKIKQLDGQLLLETYNRGAVIANDLNNYWAETHTVGAFIASQVHEFRAHRLNFLNNL